MTQRHPPSRRGPAAWRLRSRSTPQQTLAASTTCFRSCNDPHAACCRRVRRQSRSWWRSVAQCGTRPPTMPAMRPFRPGTPTSVSSSIMTSRSETVSASLPDLLSPGLRPLTLEEVRNTLFNMRTATLDLDSVYGLPAPRVGQKMKIGNVSSTGNNAIPLGRPAGKADAHDLPRDARSPDPRMDRAALIGDPRNDENTIVAQLPPGIPARPQHAGGSRPNVRRGAASHAPALSVDRLA